MLTLDQSMTNGYIEIEKDFKDKLFKRTKFMYIDLPEYLADDILYRNNIKSLKFKFEYKHYSNNYHVIIVSIKDYDREKFTKSIEELFKKMLLFNHTDYAEKVDEIFTNILQSFNNKEDEDDKEK